MEYAYHVCNTLAGEGLAAGLERLLDATEAKPVILCIGSDLAIGDSLGPLVGTMLRCSSASERAYLYGTLRSPITAKEIKYMRKFLQETHPNSKVIAIDAAVGERSELGLLKLSDSSLKPGSGANKRLGAVGDLSLLGIVGEKAEFSYSTLNLTRLSLIYSMAETVCYALQRFLEDRADKKSQFAI